MISPTKYPHLLTISTKFLTEITTPVNWHYIFASSCPWSRTATVLESQLGTTLVSLTTYFLYPKINSDLLKTVDDEGRKSSTTNTFSFVFEVRRLHKWWLSILNATVITVTFPIQFLYLQCKGQLLCVNMCV